MSLNCLSSPNGQLEWVNNILEQNLQCFIKFHRGDSVQYLSFAESLSTTTLNIRPPRRAPFFFFLNYSFHLQFYPCLPSTSHIPATSDVVKHLHHTHEELTQWDTAKTDYKQFADCHCQANLSITIVDKVWLSTRHLDTSCPSCKLD